VSADAINVRPWKEPENAMMLVRPGNLDRVYHGFGARRKQKRLCGSRKRRDLVQPLAKLDVGLIGHDLEGGVGEGVNLLLDRRDHLGMAVASVEHCDAAGKVDVALAVPVPKLGAFGSFGKDRIGRGHPARDSRVPPSLKRCVDRHVNPPTNCQ
jgi:hypothetical protein